MTDSPGDGALLQSEASLVLARATEIEVRRGDDVSVADLRAAAVDAGISSAAFDSALAELRADAVAKRPNSLALLRRASLATLGAGLGWLAYALSADFQVDANVTIQFSLILAFFSVCGLAVARRRDRDVLGFGLDLAALWIGLTLVLMLFDPADAGEMLTQMGLVGGVAAVLGSMVVASLPASTTPLQLPDVNTSKVSEDPVG